MTPSHIIATKAMSKLIPALLVATVVVVGAKQQNNSAVLPAPLSGPVTTLASPAPDGAMYPNLVTDRTGRVWMSWLETRTGGGHRFRLASLTDSTWSTPITVAEGTDFIANWADFPSVFVTGNGTLAAHWLVAGAARGSYGVRVRTSRDSGATWTPAATPHRDDSAAEHGFVSFFDTPDGSLGLAWLDGREQAGGHAAAGHGGGNMTLRATTVRNGVPGEEMQVDARVCDCCQTSAARTSTGVVLAYRDRSEKEIRDISVVRFANGKWSAPVTVGADQWEINGCPVNGPAIAAQGNAVAVAWYTQVATKPKTEIAFSTDGGATFGTATRIDTAETYGRVHVAMIDADRALVSSLERNAGSVQIVAREVARDGRLSPSVPLGPATIERSGGFARMVISKRRVIAAWTETRAGAAPRLRVISAPLR